MYIKKILLALVILGLVLGSIFAYTVYSAIFSPNTKFNNEEAFLYVPSQATITDVTALLDPLLDNSGTFLKVAQRKGYATNVKGGKYVIRKGMNNNDIVNTLRSGNIPVKVAFNNQETLADLAGRISSQIEPDSLSLLTAITDKTFIEAQGFNDATKISMYIPNSYELFWNTSPEQFRDRMLKEYNRFWNSERREKAQKQGLTPHEVVSLASIVHKETAKVDERPRVAGLYLNRLKKKMKLQADPTVIYSLKLHFNNFDTIIRRVLYKDLELDSPYNTYKYSGIPPGPITMPDISAVQAVLDPEEHGFIFMVANVEDFGYHKFAKTSAQHSRNKAQYIRWINGQNINR